MVRESPRSVVLKVRSLDQQQNQHLGLLRNVNSWAPSGCTKSEIVEMEPSNLCFNLSPGNSYTCYSLRVITLEIY